MVYGRLDVFWPDGKLENIALKADNVSIGRSIGNVIPFETDTLSRYHVNIYRDSSGVHIQDLESANGTFVDGVRLKANQPTLLSGGEEIQIGYLRMTFHRLDDSPTMQLAAMEDTQRIQRETRAFRMEVQPPPIAVAPCAYTSAEISIFNNSDKQENYQVAITGMPDNWIRISRSTIEVAPQESAVVLVNIKPLRRSDSVPGVYNVVASVRTQSKASDVLEAPFKVTILPFAGFGLALGSPRVGMGDRFKLHVHNQGSAPLPIQVSGRSKAQDMQFILNPSQLTLNPGQRFQIIGEIRPGRRRWLGNTTEYPFDLVVQSMDNARFTAATTGRVLEKPPLPVWGGAAVGVVAFFALALILLGSLALLNRVPEPEVVSFTINNGSRQIAQGQPLLLDWQTENADFVTVQVNDQIVLSQQPTSAEGVIVDTQAFQAFNGSLNISVIASRDGQDNAIETLTLSISDTVAEPQFTISPQPLIRYVVQTATIRYNVPGASGITISGSGLDEVLQQDLILPPGNSAEISIPILPVNDFSMTLSANTEAETTLQETINVLLVDPACAPIGTSAVNVYTQPDLNSTIATSIDPGTRVVINGRAGAWLRFSPPDLTADAWGQRTSFACDTSFNVEDLREVVIDVLLSTRTPTPTIAAPITVVPRTSTPLSPAISTPIFTPNSGANQAAPTAAAPTGLSGATSLPPLPVVNPTTGPSVTVGVTIAAPPSN